MSEEDLQLLITMDDAGEEPEEDTFHLHKNTLEYWLGQPCQLERAEAASDDAAFKVTFGQGDWTCTVSRLSGTTNVLTKGFDENVIEPANKKFDIEVCTVTQRKDGEIVEQKVFYDLVGMQKQIQVM